MRLLTFLRNRGFSVCPTGQEHWLNPEFHQQIRHIHNDETVDLIRYFPDLVVYHEDTGCFLLQAKSTTPEYYNGENFSIETTCLRVDKNLQQVGIRVLVVFENHPSEFYAAWANEIQPVFETAETRGFKGSRTPTSLVKKDSIPKLESKLWE